MAKRIIDKPHCDGKWTLARKRSFIISALRRASGRWSPKNTAIKEARVARNTYICSVCNRKVGNKMIRADHIEPVVPTSGFTTWDSFIERLFVEKEGYAAVCKDCHSIKTKQENQERKEYKKNKDALAVACKELEMNYATIKSEEIRNQ